MAVKEKVTLFWFRNDLRIRDNHGLYEALKNGKVVGFYVFEDVSDIPPELQHRNDYLKNAVKDLSDDFNTLNILFETFNIDLISALNELELQYEIEGLYANRSYSPEGRKTEQILANWTNSKEVQIHFFEDYLLFPPDAVLKKDLTPYTVFTPFYKACMKLLETRTIKEFDSLNTINPKNILLKTISKADSKFSELSSSFFENYEKTKDFPFKNATSGLGIYLNSGQIGIREIWRYANQFSSENFLKELVWRAFFSQLLYHFPHTQNSAFKPKYDRIPWRINEDDFEAWTLGKTGFPLVDAGMRQLRATGEIPNRVRMIVSSFLCKHLLIDWRWGETYFAQTLLDYEPASNVGNWQWAASSGADAVPYFRIFNPKTQLEKFDPKKEYVKKWIPELDTPDYPKEIIAHDLARERCLNVFKKALTSDF